MKTTLVLLCMGFLCQRAAAQTDALESEKQALRALGATYEKAINSGDLRTLASSLTPTASAVFMTGDELKSLNEMQAFFDSIKKRLGEGSSYSVKLVPDDTQFFGDIALAHGTANETVKLGNGSSFSYTTRWTALLRKLGGAWKAERLHVSLNPLDNPIVAARCRAQNWTIGMVTTAMGIAVGFLAARLRRKA